MIVQFEDWLLVPFDLRLAQSENIPTTIMDFLKSEHSFIFYRTYSQRKLHSISILSYLLLCQRTFQVWFLAPFDLRLAQSENIPTTNILFKFEHSYFTAHTPKGSHAQISRSILPSYESCLFHLSCETANICKNVNFGLVIKEKKLLFLINRMKSWNFRNKFLPLLIIKKKI